MAYLDHVRACNAHDLSRYVPFLAAGRRVGWVKLDLLDRLRPFAEVLKVTDDAVVLAPELETFDARSAAMERVARDLAETGLLPAWRDEPYGVPRSLGGTPLFQIDRSAVVVFGIGSVGVHMNGFVRRAEGLHLWIGRRHRGKQTYPGMLDNMVAGGQPLGISLRDNLAKECEEEAGIPPGLAAQAVPVGLVSYCAEEETGLKPDVLVLYDLELPGDFRPENRDGEIESFHLWPAERVLEIVRDSRAFKFNCNLVLIDLAIRHGLIAPEAPDYLDLARGLRR